MFRYIFALLMCGGLRQSLEYADFSYFVCGPDEDGCSSAYYTDCLCMPYDGVLAAKPYCLNLDDVSCKPLSLVSHCDSGYIFKDQGTCLAVAFQSEPEPPCILMHRSFCVSHHVPICDKDGGEHSCYSIS